MRPDNAQKQFTKKNFKKSVTITAMLVSCLQIMKRMTVEKVAKAVASVDSTYLDKNNGYIGSYEKTASQAGLGLTITE